MWVDIDVDDALELLGSSFENREVRSYAVTQLESANDDVSESATCTMQCLVAQMRTLVSHSFVPHGNRIYYCSFCSLCKA